ncbi:MAG: PEGA domain-containing protein [Candidatus Omnitrophica bacterium]|nr:PEGA domain-containing protein [Candidatus Omnitrophota bacterium]
MGLFVKGAIKVMVQKIRAVLFYLSVVLFLALTPVILFYSFGYKLDIDRLRIIKTGLIYLKSTPDGARVYLDTRRLNQATPVSIEGLLPGEYTVFLELEEYYPWYQKVRVESGKFTVLDNIVLFPVKPYLGKINAADVDDFYIFPNDKDYIYYIHANKTAISRVSLNPREKEAELLTGRVNLAGNIKDFSLSPDKNKILYFYGNKLDVVYLDGEKQDFFITADHKIISAFWYSDSERVVAVTDNDIRIYELSSQGRENTVKILNINDRRSRAFYDNVEDTLYFTDTQVGADGNQHRGLYRMDISKRAAPTLIDNIEQDIRYNER